MNLIYDEKAKVGILEGKICPFRNPLILPGHIAGQVTIENMPCSTACTLFSFHTNETEKNIAHCDIVCGSSPIQFKARIITQNKMQLI